MEKEDIITTLTDEQKQLYDSVTTTADKLDLPQSWVEQQQRAILQGIRIQNYNSGLTKEEAMRQAKQQALKIAKLLRKEK